MELLMQVHHFHALKFQSTLSKPFLKTEQMVNFRNLTVRPCYSQQRWRDPINLSVIYLHHRYSTQNLVFGRRMDLLQQMALSPVNHLTHTIWKSCLPVKNLLNISHPDPQQLPVPITRCMCGACQTEHRQEFVSLCYSRDENVLTITRQSK